MSESNNPLGIDGIACVEFSAPTREGLDELGRLFKALGLSRTRRHAEQAVEYYRQHEICFLVNREPGSFAAHFAAEHGSSISAMGWWVENAEVAVEEAVRRGARRYTGPSSFGDAPAIYGIGDSLIFFLDKLSGKSWERWYLDLEAPELVPERGFFLIDHLTNNVPQGTMERWRAFYRDVFGFTDVRTFDIRGEQTGLTSYALRSPCGKFCIPINEGSEEKSQIEEYLREYKGAGIQHLALLSGDLLRSLGGLADAGVETLDIDPEYYDSVFQRVPNVREDHTRIRDLEVLVDGDEAGYLLQIFTKNVIGPIFFEMIQRNNHLSFGEGNFGALFRSIERDQERRGVL